MALRSNWKGFLKLSLVSVPVKAISAVTSEDGEIHFHQLHETCHRRIQYKKTCPQHGEVPASEIVSGYEYAKGEYVVFSDEELKALRGEADKSVNVESIVPATSIDSLYYTERSSYLIPDGAIAQKPYAVIIKCLMEGKMIAIGRLSVTGKDDVVAIRPYGDLLMMTGLHDASRIQRPDVFADAIQKTSISASELKLTKTLFQAFESDSVDLADYHREYRERVREMIEEKIKGHELVVPPASDEPDVINLMDALKKSVARAKTKPAKTLTKAPAKAHGKTRTVKGSVKQKSKTA